jgi:hypothetical protein
MLSRRQLLAFVIQIRRLANVSISCYHAICCYLLLCDALFIIIHVPYLIELPLQGLGQHPSLPHVSSLFVCLILS